MRDVGENACCMPIYITKLSLSLSLSVSLELLFLFLFSFEEIRESIPKISKDIPKDSKLEVALIDPFEKKTGLTLSIFLFSSFSSLLGELVSPLVIASVFIHPLAAAIHFFFSSATSLS